MPERPIEPPLRQAIREQFTPVHTNGYYAELVDRTDDAYQAIAPIRRGTLYSTIQGAKQEVIDAFPNLYFVREFTPLGGGDIRSMPGSKYVIWYWASDVAALDSFNAAIDYLGDAVACPTYAREYVVRRDTYDATPTIATASALTALLGIKVIAGGTAYKATDTVNVAGGLGAEAVLVVDTAGAIISVIVTKSGSGYDSASLPAITITTTTGSGATLAALVQPKTAVLTSQKKVELPPDDPMANEFVKAIKIYETLPGPYIPINRYDADLGVITGRRRAVLNSGQAAAVTNAHSLRYEGRENSSTVSWEIEEAWDNTSFPLIKDNYNDPERGPVYKTTQATTDTATAGSSTVSGGTSVITTRYEGIPSNPSLRRKVIETWAVPRTRTSKKTNALKQVVTVAETREDVATTPATPTATKDVDFKVVGDGTAIETSETVPSVFDRDTRSIEIPDVTPAWAKALLPTTSTSSEAAATSVSDPTLSTGQIRKQVQRTTEKTVQTEITARDTASLPKTRTNKKLSREFGGGLIDIVQTQAVGSQTPSSGALMVVDSEMEVLGDGTSVLSTSTGEDAAWPVLSDYDIDEETGQTILTTYQVVAAGTAGTATISSGVVTRYKHIDKWRSMKIVATYSTPAMYEEQRFGAHNFPTLWDGVYHWSTECGAFATGFRGGFSAMVRMRTEVSFGTSRNANIDGLTLIPKTLILGRGVQLPPDLIMDSGSFIYSGTCSGTASFGASSPNYTTYIGSIQGTEQLITGESVKFGKGGLYRTTKVYCLML